MEPTARAHVEARLGRALRVFEEALGALLVAVMLGVFVRTYLFQAFRIPSVSMEQNLLPGDHILVNKFIFATGDNGWLPGRSVARGDVVIFRFPYEPTRDFVKRCVGLPGDTIELRERRLWINQQPVNEDAYLPAPLLGPVGGRRRPRDDFGPLTIPPDQYFCLGDNRDNSDDSRFWGTVPRRYIKGRAVLIYWSLENTARAGAMPRWRRLFRLVH